MVSRKRYPSFDKLIDATEEIAEQLVEEGATVAIAGGLALQFYGSPRLTNDVDLLATSIGIPNFKEALSFGGKRGRASNKVDVDVIVRDDKWARLYRAALQEATPVEDSPIAVVDPEYLLIMKMVARRDKDNTDIMFLLTEDIVDHDVCRDLIVKFLGEYAVDDFNALCDEAAWELDKRTKRGDR